MEIKWIWTVISAAHLILSLTVSKRQWCILVVCRVINKTHRNEWHHCPCDQVIRWRQVRPKFSLISEDCRGTGSLLGSSTKNKEVKPQLAAYRSQVVNAAPELLWNSPGQLRDEQSWESSASQLKLGLSSNFKAGSAVRLRDPDRVLAEVSVMGKWSVGVKTLSNKQLCVKKIKKNKKVSEQRQTDFWTTTSLFSCSFALCLSVCVFGFWSSRRLRLLIQDQPHGQPHPSSATSMAKRTTNGTEPCVVQGLCVCACACACVSVKLLQNLLFPNLKQPKWSKAKRNRAPKTASDWLKRITTD